MELLNWITLVVAVASFVLGIVNLMLLLRIGKQVLSDLKQWQLGVERQLDSLDGTVTRLTAEADRRRGSSDGREE